MMRKQFIGLVAIGALFAGPAIAADMAMKAPPPAPMAPPAPSWTGCYVGGNVGAAWTRQSQNRVDVINNSGTITAAPSDYGTESDSGPAGGFQVGCDYQFAAGWVIGAQGMFDWTDLKGSHALPAFPTFIMNDKTDRFDTVTGRLGYVFFDNSLVYVKGGGAWVRNSDTLLQPSGALSEAASWTATGWTIGGGFEYRFLPNWSLFVEYDHMDFGTKTIQFVAPPGLSAAGEHVSVAQRIDMVSVGLNWRFNFFDGGKMVARY